MPSIQLEPYVFSISEKYHRSQIFDLHKIIREDTEISVLDIFAEYLKNRKNTPLVTESSSAYFNVAYYEPEPNLISGLFEKGYYGEEADIVDTNTADLLYTKPLEAALLNPYYFLIIIPKSSEQPKKGVILLQRTGLLGVKTMLTYDFVNFLNEEFSELSFSIDRLVTEEIYKKMFGKAAITELIVTKYGIPQQFEDEFNLGPVEDDSVFEMHLKPGRGNYFKNLHQKIKDNMFDSKNETKLFSPKFVIPDNYKIRTEINGRQRTFDLLDLENMNATLDISDKVTYGEDGLPSFDSLHEQGLEFANELLESLGYELE